MAPARQHPERAAPRVPLQQRYQHEQERLQQRGQGPGPGRGGAGTGADPSPTALASTSTGAGDAGASASTSTAVTAPAPESPPLPSVDLRNNPDIPDALVKELSCYGGKLTSLLQVVALDRFSALAALCIHGCFLTRMDVDPVLRACGHTLTELNLSSNRITRIDVGRCRLTASEPNWKRAWFQRLRLKCGEALSNVAFKFNLRRYIEGLPALPALRSLDLTNNRVSRLDGRGLH
jgi:Leucine-rich repeat (LRR) protein